MSSSTPIMWVVTAVAVIGFGQGAAAQDGPTGACCFPNGQCFEFTEEDCDTTNGVYQGDGVECANTNCQCTADIDGSGDIGFEDLLNILASWGPCEDCPADVNGDDVVDVLDLLTVLVVIGTQCNPTPVAIDLGTPPIVVAVNVSAIVGTPVGLNSWRINAVFDNDTAKVLAVVAHPSVGSIEFETDDPAGLTNDCIIEVHQFEDFPSAEGLCARYDSYMTIGVPIPDNGTMDTPGFLGGNGNDRVIEGTAFQDDNGAWFDTAPGATGPGVDLAQFTVATTTTCVSPASSRGSRRVCRATCSRPSTSSRTTRRSRAGAASTWTIVSSRRSPRARTSSAAPTSATA